ncbi:DUF4159 domain-containing protein [Candidatus Poribacteria bacterium]|nr:DUF4159 domain-containing protein [Candidatus Poribacteria bacterium]
MHLRRVQTGLSRGSRGAMTISFALHLVGLVGVSVYLVATRLPYADESQLAIEWVELPQEQVRRLFPRKEPMPVTKTMPLTVATRTTPMATFSPNMIPEVVRRSSNVLTQSVEVNPHPVRTALPQITTAASLNTSRASATLPERSSTPFGDTSGRGVETGRTRAAAGVLGRQGLSIVESTGTQGLGISQPKFVDTTALLADAQLGAVLQGKGRDITGHIRIIRVKHTLSDWWQDPTAMASMIENIQANTRLRADMKFEGGALPLTDDRILDAPLLVMTGHDKDITVSRNMVRGGPLTDGLTDAERVNLRRYLLDRKGTLFFDDCGFNGIFAEQVRQELRHILPEYDLQDIPHNHEIYTVYYELSGPPTGGDVFWNSENNPQVSRFRSHKGITIDGRLAVLYNRKDYMCAMETAEIESRTMLRLRRSPDVYRFMTNLLVYAMKYGGNVDRTHYSSR